MDWFHTYRAAGRGDHRIFDFDDEGRTMLLREYYEPVALAPGDARPASVWTAHR